MNSWHQVALLLDKMYTEDPRIARRQIKNQPQLLVLEETHYKFFPIRRLADGLSGKEMDAPRSTAQEVQRYRYELISAGFREIVEGDPRHQILLDRLTDILMDKYNDKPSPSAKTFWVLDDEIHEDAIVPSRLEHMDRPNVGAEPAIVERLPNSQLRKVTSDHIRRSIDALMSGKEVPNFAESTDYDVLLPDGTRLAPKKVFGLALAEALGVDVFPGHFSGGLNQPSFDIIESAGFHIVPKPEHPASPQEVEQALREVPIDDSDKSVIEGNPRFLLHMRRERASGLARQKKEAFLREHGELFCERCGLRPVSIYGPYVGESCIEVHHARTQVKDMLPGHQTKLEDLQCLCANCHRITHREMTLGIVAGN